MRGAMAIDIKYAFSGAFVNFANCMNRQFGNIHFVVSNYGESNHCSTILGPLCGGKINSDYVIILDILQMKTLLSMIDADSYIFADNCCINILQIGISLLLLRLLRVPRLLCVLEVAIGPELFQHAGF